MRGPWDSRGWDRDDRDRLTPRETETDRETHREAGRNRQRDRERDRDRDRQKWTEMDKKRQTRRQAGHRLKWKVRRRDEKTDSKPWGDRSTEESPSEPERSRERGRGALPWAQPLPSGDRAGATGRPGLAGGPHSLPLSYSCPEHLGRPVLGPRSWRLMRPASVQSPRAQPRGHFYPAYTRGTGKVKNKERKHLKHQNPSELGGVQGPWSSGWVSGEARGVWPSGTL